MDSEELNKLANQFITLWQENFAKAMADPKIIESMMGATGNMQQFYGKFPNSFFNQSAAAAYGSAHDAGADELRWSKYSSKINELEQRIAELEAELAKRAKPASKRGGKPGKK